jgi:uncharacterized protein YndB with AHSA1/START domain
MADILHDFPIAAPAARVFAAVSTPAGLDEWWTLRSAGRPATGERWRLDFGPGYEWTAVVRHCEPAATFELELVDAMPDWAGTRVRFDLAEADGSTALRFAHTRWPSATEHFRVSSFCWAMYLRVLRRFVEHGERVPYDRRLEV